jgi:hypothetical protein
VKRQAARIFDFTPENINGFNPVKDQPLQLVEVSEAALNKLLFVKYQLDDKQLLVTYAPNQNSGMTVRIGLTYSIKPNPSLNNGLAVDKGIQTGNCVMNSF